MIVVPQALTDLLSAADPPYQGRLALDFAQHVVDTRLEPPDVREVFTAYLVAARRFLAGDGDINEVASWGSRFYDAWPRQGVPFEVGSVVRLAVLASCQRALEDAGAIVRQRYLPDAVAVAREAQAVAGKAVDDPSAARQARWEEARWQLMRTIEHAPNPHRESAE